MIQLQTVNGSGLGFAGLSGLTRSQVTQVQTILHSRWGMAATVGTIDGILGPRTYNALTQVIGPSWSRLSADDLINRLNGTGATRIDKMYLSSYPFPERVKIAQRILGVTVDGKLGPKTAAALSSVLPDWKGRSWAAHMPDNVPDSLAAKNPFPQVPPPGVDEPTGGLNPPMIDPSDVLARLGIFRNKLVASGGAASPGGTVKLTDKDGAAATTKAGFFTPLNVGIGAAVLLAGAAVLASKKKRQRRRRR